MPNKEYDIVIIGGGPAGLTAAVTASANGAITLLIDERDVLGGNYYKQLAVGKNSLSREQQKKFNSLKIAFEKSSTDYMMNTGVWGIFDHEGNSLKNDQGADTKKFTLKLTRSIRGSSSITAKKIIIATGVYDRPLPFPGWELPGVVTPGAVQTQLEKQGILPGKKVIVAGSGPLQLLVAASLVKNGAQVVAYLDTSSGLEGVFSILPALPALMSRLREGFFSILTLARAGVPMRFRHAVYKARSSDNNCVNSVTFGKIDKDGNPIWGTEQELAVDTVCVGYGFIPSTAITMLIGCEHTFDEHLKAFIPMHDKAQRSSKFGIFLAGDITGVGGKALAELQGKNAAHSALEELGLLSTQSVNLLRSKLLNGIRREENFARWLWKRQRVRPGLLKLVEADTPVCFCEGATMKDIKESIEDGARDLFGIKLRTRVSMGHCQGRYCLSNTALLLSEETKLSINDIPDPSIRPPVFPVRLGDIQKAPELSTHETNIQLFDG